MSEILDKLSSYNIFNYLLPGILFVVILDKLTSYSLIQDNLVIGAFVYYFIGLVLSRFGSLIIEPTLKKISFLKFADYKDFVIASKNDQKIDIFSETNNMYRTFCSMFILLLLIKLYQFINFKFVQISELSPYILIFLLLIMFLASYRKQTVYITKRIKADRGLETNRQ